MCCCQEFVSGKFENRPLPLPRLEPQRRTTAEDEAYPFKHTAYPLVSVVSPTSSERSWAHAALYNSFAHQTYPNLELVVLDTGPEPSPFFSCCRDARVKYHHVPFHKRMSLMDARASLRQLAQPSEHPPSPYVPRDVQAWKEAWAPTVAALRSLEADTIRHAMCGAKGNGVRHVRTSVDDETVPEECRKSLHAAIETGLPLGAKRNWIAAHARGDVHANFDDDDVYLPTYVERMVGALHSSRAELVKLSSWLEFNAVLGRLVRLGSSRSDRRELLPPGKNYDNMYDLMPHSLQWGFGFSYVHTARLAWRVPYPPMDMGEDYKKVTLAAAFSVVGGGGGGVGGQAKGSNGGSPLEMGPCCCFADSVGDAVVCHVAHKTNTSRTDFTSTLFEQLSPSIDAVFSHTCTHLLEAARAQVAGLEFDPLRGLFISGCGCGGCSASLQLHSELDASGTPAYVTTRASNGFLPTPTPLTRDPTDQGPH
jgi:hypothetical protein